MPSPSSDSGFLTVPENRSAFQGVRRVVRAIQAKKRLPFCVLVVHGPVGSGKSHLVSTATNEIANHLTRPAVDLGRRESTSDPTLVDLLAIEDVQNVKARDHDRLVRLLDERSSRGLITLMTSTDSPAFLTSLPHRLTSRLIGGLVVPISPLSAASRVKLARRVAKERGHLLPEELAINLARRTAGGTRPLLGAVDDWIARKALRLEAAPIPEIAIDPAAHPLVPIAEQVARQFGVSVNEIRGPRRLKTVSTARQVVSLIGREEMKLTVQSVANYLNRVPSSIFESDLDLRRKLARDPQLTIRVNQVIEECRELIRKLVAQMARD